MISNSKMNKKNRYSAIIGWFIDNVPVAQTELHFKTPYQLLVAVILSAQCTDKRVNMVTPIFFEHFPNVFSLASSSPEEIFKVIKSISYPNNKSKHLHGAAKMLVEKFNGEVPSEVEELQMLPGVGRKTANVIASVVFNKPVIAVDTHVFRVSKRLGLSSANDVNGVEADLTQNIAPQYRAIAHHWLILHGRYICKARSPLCDECGLRVWCKYYNSLKNIPE